VRRHDYTRARGAEGGSNAAICSPFAHEKKRGDDEMTKHTATRWTEQHDTEAGSTAKTCYLELASEAVLAGMTRDQVIAQLASRIKRDEGYLAYRRASGRRTRYDEQVTSDLRALALAAVLLEASPQVAGPANGL
jgi:hypothetical protein